ncbi:TetR family transcriptional regulator [Microbacterium faecale]|uniref:TetR family transcriptional regulator n=1 Tax=Microbacterium faecale TaxID=1804630 RepID=A0A916Y9U3_9MICO|nr:TetR/AcrR family transcriptional regulator [Microbacterium faecale]GGD36546.1 TetR family transcriptional regulator [Microbacterium faecale]
MTTGRRDAGAHRESTLATQARRAQLLDVTIGIVAEHGYAQTSLARIAEGAGVTKAAVLYHYPTKDALVETAYEHVLTALIGEVAAAVEGADPAEGPAVYVRSMVGHLAAHPRHSRMIIEAMTNAGADHDPRTRWEPLAQIIEAAARARGVEPVDARATALIAGGGIDALVAEHLHDPGYDVTVAAETLVRMLDTALSR